MISKQKKRKMNPMLLNVLLISGAFHVAAILVFGSYTVYNLVIPDDAQFEEPPTEQEEEPPRDVKVEIKQQTAPQDQSMQRLQMKQVGNIAVDAINVDVPDMQESFTVSAGMGGFGGGPLLGGSRGSIGIGMSDVNVFGLKSRAERILFVIDANRQMVTDKKGGLNSYNIIKDEIVDMVGNLSTGTLFNVMIVDRRRSMLFKPQLVSAGLDVHQELVDWMRPINKNAQNPGLEGVYGANRAEMKSLGREAIQQDMDWSRRIDNETLFMTQVALEQGVDAIFFITGHHRGFDGLRRMPTEVEKADWERVSSSRKYQKQLAAHGTEHPDMRKRINEALAKINKERASKGQPPRVLDTRHGILAEAEQLGLEWETKHPGHQPSYFRDASEVEDYFKRLIDVLYTNNDDEKPIVNVVLFLAGDEELRKEWEDQLDDFVDFFRGDYRIIRGLDEIKRARSAASTEN